MDDRPVSGAGLYEINWEEIDEQSDPFVKSDKSAVNQNVHGPPKPLKGGGPVNAKTSTSLSFEQPSQDLSLSQSAPLVGLSDKTKNVPPKQSNSRNSVGNRESEVKNFLPLANGQMETACSLSKLDNLLQSQQQAQSPCTPSIPSPEELSKALEHAALAFGTDSNLTLNETNQPPGASYPNQLQPDDTSALSTGTTSNNSTSIYKRVDSSTRPASPAQPDLLANKSGSILADKNQAPASKSVNASHGSNDSAALLSVDPNKVNPPLHKQHSNCVHDSEIEALRKERDELMVTVEEMKHCITEYDRSLQHLMTEKSQVQTQANVSVSDLITERDQAIEELATIEKAFGDLHRRFEKSKQIIEGFKKNEEALKRSIEEYKNLLQRQERKYLALKKHAEDQLLKVNQDTEAAKQEFETNSTKLQAALRISELQVKSLETQLEQKTRQNEELTKICDELLSKYGNVT